MTTKKLNFHVDGMHCASCKQVIEREAKKQKGVKEISVDYATGEGTVTYNSSKTNSDKIFDAIEKHGYECSLSEDDESPSSGGNSTTKTLGLLFTVAGLLVAGYYLFGFIENMAVPEISANMGYGLLFVVGLLTGFHCVSMCGGFVVGYTAKNAEKGLKSHESHLMYGAGKTLSYTIIGAVFGLIGSIITFTPMMRGVAGVIAGIFLIVYGINMLNIFPLLRRFTVHTPQFVSRFVGTESKKHKSPLVIGLLNGLMIACGPLQAIYIMAAGTGSAIEGAKILFVFALGTLPVMLSFGYLTSFLSGKATRNILKFSGIVVIFLGLIMVNRGLALTGTGADATSLLGSVQGNNAGSINQPSDPNGNPVTIQDNYQIIRMDVTSSGYQPNNFVLKKGVPVKWIINGKQITGCNKAIQVPKLGLQFDIKPGEQTIEFTPTEEGTIPWSCWMGMLRGTFIVKSDTTTNTAAINQPSPATPSTATSTVGSNAATIQGNYQTIRMDVARSGYQPNQFVLKTGVPVKWIINGKELTGCNSGIKVPQLGLQFDIKQGEQTIEFTPTEEGTISWSCWMGMLRGTFVVKSDIDTTNPQAVQEALNSVPPQPQGGTCGGGGGCGCGMM